MLDTLPSVNEKRLAIRVTKDAMRQIRGGHPWVYDGSITSRSHAGSSGDLAVVFNDDRKFAAIGLYDPDSPIEIKILHRGKPRTIDAEFWADRVGSALTTRSGLVEDDSTTAWRVINGENDGFPGLVLDRYDSTLVLKLYTNAWLPHLRDIEPVIVEWLEPESIVVRFGRATLAGEQFGLFEGAALFGETPDEPVRFLENGLHFEADVVEGQKTGHFLDQRENRAMVGTMAEEARVLDVFSCTGGFSVYAAAGGALEVTSVDQSPGAIETAQRNVDHNRADPFVERCDHHVIVGDAFDVMHRLWEDRRRFDVVVIDPPSFAQKQDSIRRGLSAYRRLTEAALKLLPDDGVLVQASCSSRISGEEFFATIHDAAQASQVKLTTIARTGHAVDHPVTFDEGRYLKALFARVKRF